MLLRSVLFIGGRRNGKITTLVFVEKPTEDRGGIEIRPGEQIVISWNGLGGRGGSTPISESTNNRQGSNQDKEDCVEMAKVTHQHIKSTLPSIPTRAQVCILPIKP